MLQLNTGVAVTLRICPYFPSGRDADLRFAEGLLPYIVKPSGDSVALRRGVTYNEMARTVTAVLPAGLLSEEGTYSLVLNVRLGREVWASSAVQFAEVVSEGGEEKRPLTPVEVIAELDLLDYPSNVVVTGASPRIADNGDWLCWDDAMLCYVDTGIRAGDGGGGGADIEEITPAEVDSAWDEIMNG